MANVTVDLGDIGTLTVQDVTLPGTTVGLVDCMKHVLDLYRPPPKDEEGNIITPKTGADYVADLLDFIGNRGKTDFIKRVQRRVDALVSTPDVRDYITLQ